MNEECNRTGYAFSRQYFDWAFEHPSENNTAMTALYFFLVEVNNRLGWKKEFGITSRECMEAIGITSYNTYKKNFDKLVEIGFIKVVKRSINQYQANIIALSNFDKAHNKALDKALSKHVRHSINNKTINNKTVVESSDSTDELLFENIWNLYGKKGNKKTSQKKWDKLSKSKKELALSHIPQYVQSTPNKQYRKNFETYINQEVWNDEIQLKHKENETESTIHRVNKLHPALID